MRKVLSFYKYVKIDDPGMLASDHLKWCLSNSIKGKVYLAEEGINGTVFGTYKQMEAYKEHLKSLRIFKDIWFKETETDIEAFSKMHVRVKNEIVNSGFKIDLRNEYHWNIRASDRQF